VSAPASLYFIVSECGISVLQDNNHTTLISDQTNTSKNVPDQRPSPPSAEIQLETTSAQPEAARLANEATTTAEIEDEYDKLWTKDTYSDFDWDVLEQVLTQTV